MSELAGPWLNLPILVAGTSDLVKNSQNDQDGKKFVFFQHFKVIYNFIYISEILQHHQTQDNVEEVFIIFSSVGKMQLMII